MLNDAELISEADLKENSSQATQYNLFTLIERNAAHVAGILLERKKSNNIHEARSLATLLISEAFRRAADRATHDDKMPFALKNSHVYTAQFANPYDHSGIPLLNEAAEGDEAIFKGVERFLDECFSRPKSVPEISQTRYAA